MSSSVLPGRLVVICAVEVGPDHDLGGGYMFMREEPSQSVAWGRRHERTVVV